MGCATSKPKVCQNCQARYSPVRPSDSMHVHYRSQRQGDSYHGVSLTSSTLGSLQLDVLDQNHQFKKEAAAPIQKGDDGQVESIKEEFMLGVVEAKNWSRMIDEKIPKVVPKTPTRTPPGEPETINAWDLMEGLEDTSPFKPPHHYRSFSFDMASNKDRFLVDLPAARVHENGDLMPKPLRSETAEADYDSNSTSNDTSVASEFDPDVISTFRKAPEDVPQANPVQLGPLISEKQQALNGKAQELELTGTMKKINGNTEGYKSAPRGKDKVIVYFTSLRGVRKTYEDCCSVRVILKGLGVKIDERDVSMHSGFKEELKELLGEGWFNNGALPKVFVGKRYIGGAEEIRRMHEDGQLEEAVENCVMVDDVGGGVGGKGGVCEACGDIRFVPCDSCTGSCKIYHECDYDEEYEEAEYGFQRCPHCNENGLIRCPICCD